MIQGLQLMRALVPLAAMIHVVNKLLANAVERRKFARHPNVHIVFQVILEHIIDPGL